MHKWCLTKEYKTMEKYMRDEQSENVQRSPTRVPFARTWHPDEHSPGSVVGDHVQDDESNSKPASDVSAAPSNAGSSSSRRSYVSRASRASSKSWEYDTFNHRQRTVGWGSKRTQQLAERTLSRVESDRQRLEKKCDAMHKRIDVMIKAFGETKV